MASLEESKKALSNVDGSKWGLSKGGMKIFYSNRSELTFYKNNKSGKGNTILYFVTSFRLYSVR